MNDSVGVYIHIPFCKKKCVYCDFHSETSAGELVDRYVNAVKKEIELRAGEVSNRDVVSIFFGGGTPSILSPANIMSIIGSVCDGMNVEPEAEITIECNPESLTEAKADGYLEAGVNRISVGVQSTNDERLRFLGRVHTGNEARKAVKRVFKAGFTNVSVDLIYGIPDQSKEEWIEQLREVSDWGVKSLSCYELTKEPGTPLWDMDFQTGDSEGELFDITERLLQKYGFEHYEISNYARPGFESLHNTGYWEYRDYLGVGASASSLIRSVRRENVRGVDRYIGVIEEGDTCREGSLERLTTERERLERLMNGLRLRRGIDSFPIEVTDGMRKMIENGALELCEGRLRTTKRGFRLLDTILESI